MHAELDSTDSQQPHLLVVDDSRLMRHAIRKILGNEYRITEAVDGESAWLALKQHADIQVIFSDLSMPNLDGFGLLERIRSDTDATISSLPVVIITGSEDDDSVRAEAMHYGASDFISKPIGASQLRTRAKTHLNLKQTSKKLDQTESQLEEHSITDMLTGLNNKNYFNLRIDKDLSYAKRHQTELSIILLGIDNLNKQFLEYGKPVINEVLKQVATIGRNNTRNEDTLARIGLSKLAFILPSTDLPGAQCISERICEQVNDLHIKVGETRLTVSVSLGIASFTHQTIQGTRDFLMLAENCLQRAHQQTGCSIVHDELTVDTVTDQPDSLDTPPDMNTAVELATSDSAMQLHPYLSVLLARLLPLLNLCNDKLDLGIDDAIKKIQSRLESRH